MSVYQGGGCIASVRNARLSFEDDQDRKRIRACCASSRDLQWIKVDLERVKQITAVATQGNTVIVSSRSLQRERENIRILRGHYFQKYRMSLSTVCFFLWRSVLCPGGGWWVSASNARLYFEVDDDSKRIGSWCAVDLNQQWLRIDLKQMKTITGIAIQGEIEWEDQHRKSPLRSLYICLNFRCEKELFHQSGISFFAWLWSSCVDT